MINKIIVGCGYLGQRVAKNLIDNGESIAGVVRTAASAKALKVAGISVLSLDLDYPLPASGIEKGVSLQGSELFYFAPPPSRGVIDGRVSNLIAAFEYLGHPKRVVYLSTTGVYGDCQGQWVDETWPVKPVVDRAKRRWDAEQAFRRWFMQTDSRSLVVLRVAGIYGPGKLPLERIRKGLPMVSESEAPYTNRIHVDDLVQICVTAMSRGVDGEIYNVSDGRPGTMTDYFNRVADRAGLPRPPVISLAEGEEQLSTGMMSYMRESRRLNSDKMLKDLAVTLIHPDLECGLDHCF